MPKDDKISKANPHGVIGEVFEEYFAMNEGAIIFANIYDLIKDRPDTDTISVGELKTKIEEYRETAKGKLSNFRKVIDSYKEKY